jgi:hypothetical protein
MAAVVHTQDAVQAALVSSGVAPAQARTVRKSATPEEIAKSAHLFARVAQQRMLDINVLLRSAQPGSAARNVEIVCSGAHRAGAARRWRQIAMQSIGPRAASVPVPMPAWSRSTEIPCWTCEERYDTPPMPLVLSFEPKFGVFRIEGLFCNVRCMLWHAHVRYSRTPMYADIVNMSKNIAHLYFGIPMTELYGVLPAPDPKKTLRKYQPEGGLTIEQYRDARFVARAAPVQEPPFLSFSVVLEAAGAGAGARDPTTGARVIMTGEENSSVDPSLVGVKRPLDHAVAIAGVPLRDERTGEVSRALSLLTQLPDAQLGRQSAAVRRVIRADKEKMYGHAELPAQQQLDDEAAATASAAAKEQPAKKRRDKRPASAYASAKTSVSV